MLLQNLNVIPCLRNTTFKKCQVYFEPPCRISLQKLKSLNNQVIVIHTSLMTIKFCWFLNGVKFISLSILKSTRRLFLYLFIYLFIYLFFFFFFFFFFLVSPWTALDFGIAWHYRHAYYSSELHSKFLQNIFNLFPYFPLLSIYDLSKVK